MIRSFPLWGAALVLCASVSLHAADRSFVETPDTTENQALIVGVGHGLSGIDIDLKNVTDIAQNPAYHFKTKQLLDEQGTVPAIEQNLTAMSEKAGRLGTFMFYFSGHGNVGLIWPQDDTMQVEAIRKAIEEGRRELGPLARLVLVYDTCHSGSLLDPMRNAFPLSQLNDDSIQSARLADSIEHAFTNGSRGSEYWNNLMIIASSRADETSLASAQGSIFTLAFKKAFDEVAKNGGTNADLIQKSKDYTKGHHPVARLVPESLGSEKLVR